MTTIIIIMAYLVPSALAYDRKHNNKGAIIAINVLLGWTVIGWIASFVWSLTDNRKSVVIK